jgi:hypothetical protein
MTLFGVTMSGHESAYGLFAIEISGPDMVTGGSFGIEASVPVIALTIIVSLLILRWSKLRKSSLLKPDVGPANKGDQIPG